MEGIPNNSEAIKFKEYFKTADIVILAEDVQHGLHAEEISLFLDQFHDQMSGLFLEDTISRQDSINTYLKTGEVDDNFNSMFEGALREGKDLRTSTLAVLDKAREYGIPVICFDASKKHSPEYPTKGKHGFYFLKGECRDEDMFNNVQDYYESHPGKYAVIIGGHHMTEENFEGDYKNFGPRMKEEFGEKCVAVRLTNGTSRDKGSIYDDVV